MKTFNEVRGSFGERWVPLVMFLVAVAVVSAFGQLNASRRTRENIRLCLAKYQQALTAADTAAVDGYQVTPLEPQRNGAIPVILCRKYRADKATNR